MAEGLQPEKKRPVGRPSLYPTIDQKKVEILCKRGFTDVQLAEFFDVTEHTIANWKNEHPDFLQSLKTWKASADEKVEKSLYERANGYEHPEDQIFQFQGTPVIVPTVKHYPPDTTAAIFWLKNRQPEKWRDGQEHRISGELTTKVIRLPDKLAEGAPLSYIESPHD
jgi:hypothetical protein